MLVSWLTAIPFFLTQRARLKTRMMYNEFSWIPHTKRFLQIYVPEKPLHRVDN